MNPLMNQYQLPNNFNPIFYQQSPYIAPQQFPYNVYLNSNYRDGNQNKNTNLNNSNDNSNMINTILFNMYLNSKSSNEYLMNKIIEISDTQSQIINFLNDNTLPFQPISQSNEPPQQDRDNLEVSLIVKNTNSDSIKIKYVLITKFNEYKNGLIADLQFSDFIKKQIKNVKGTDKVIFKDFLNTSDNTTVELQTFLNMKNILQSNRDSIVSFIEKIISIPLDQIKHLNNSMNFNCEKKFWDLLESSFNLYIQQNGTTGVQIIVTSILFGYIPKGFATV